ncbi:MAG: hypothetical protein GX442_03190 [Candidatus Riflebacteria bacterium]|nr:hypothetical protein [Candidatus Riflebacteria bacterium]
MRSRLALVFVVLLGLAGPPVSACDADLVALFTGERPNDVFLQSVNLLAVQAKAFGSSIDDPEKGAAEALATLMKTWVTFDNRFSQSPPSWAAADGQWTPKFKELADDIGAIDRDFRAGQTAPAHIKVLAFVRKLVKLFDQMPKTPDKEALISFSMGFQTLSEAVQTRDVKTFELGLADLASGALLFRANLASPTSAEALAFLDRVDQLQRTYAEAPGTLSVTLNMLVGITEDAFGKMNTKAREQAGGK